MLIRVPFGQFWKGMAKLYSLHLLGHLLGSFWKGMAKLYQVHLLGHLLGSFWKKIVSSTLIRAPFGQFLEGDSKIVLSTLSAPFGQFLEGHGKSLPN